MFTGSFARFVLAGFAVAQSAVALSIPCARTYTVQSGDTCNAISAAQGVSSFQLATANIGTINDACSNLFVDQVICLQRACVKCETVYVVQPGDSCTAIASAAGATLAILQANNPNLNSDCSNELLIVHFQVLCVAPTALY